MSWEDTFRLWSKPLSETAQEKAENAESVVKDAIKADVELAKLDVFAFTQGSYKANTNIRYESDVDICVVLRECFYADYPQGQKNENYGNTTSSNWKYSEFKDMVGKALENKVGKKGVTRGKKAFDVHENSYRIDADVVPAFEYRRYTGAITLSGLYAYHSGIAFDPDDGRRIINWPDQAYRNGVGKNNDTGRRYKSMVRVLKRLRNKMQDDDIEAAEDISSSLVDSLVWNVPISYFGNDQYKDDVRNVLMHTFNDTRNYEDCKEWREVNELKYLFGPWQPAPGQPWTRDKAHNFISAAWDYTGFK